MGGRQRKGGKKRAWGEDMEREGGREEKRTARKGRRRGRGGEGAVGGRGEDWEKSKGGGKKRKEERVEKLRKVQCQSGRDKIQICFTKIACNAFTLDVYTCYLTIQLVRICGLSPYWL